MTEEISSSEPSRKRPRRQIEREFGVPFPGEIVEESRWTRTSLKRLNVGLVDWKRMFEREGPVVLDLGCGNGRFLIGSAIWRPDRLHLGVDNLPLVIRYAARRANQRGVSNIRFAVCGGRELLENHVPPHSVSEIHIYHPQPYYEPQEIPLRLVNPHFLALVHRSLVPGGELYLQTDHPAYWHYMQNVAPAFFDFETRARPWPDAPKGRTRREIIALRQGLPIFRGSGRAKSGMTEELLAGLVKALPLPLFDADRSLSGLDQLEDEGERN